MASNHTLAPTPLTFELPRALVDRIHACRGRLGLKSVSEVVRHALTTFDLAAFQAPPREQLQISVRLSAAQKQRLFRGARQKRVSAGELLRAALEAVAARSRAGRAKSSDGSGRNRVKKAPGNRSDGHKRR